MAIDGTLEYPYVLWSAIECTMRRTNVRCTPSGAQRSAGTDSSVLTAMPRVRCVAPCALHGTVCVAWHVLHATCCMPRVACQVHEALMLTGMNDRDATAAANSVIEVVRAVQLSVRAHSALTVPPTE